MSNIIARPHYSIENENQYRRAIESELAKRPQLLGPNVYQGKQGGAFYDAGGAAFNPRHPKYDCKADGSTDDYARLNACFVDARAAGLPVDMGDFSYLIGTALNIADVPILGNPTIIPSGFTAEPIYADGSIGSFHNLDSNAVIGENRIECATLALLVSGGEIIKITSDADFSAAEAGIKQAEMASVRNVVGDFIYLNETLLDSYTTANGAKAAIVSLAHVDVRGRLTVSHTPAANDTNTRGVRFKYATVRGHFDLQKCRGTAASFNNCWRPDVRVDTSDSVRTGVGVTAYGISIQNATMYGVFRGVISQARHPVSCSGSPTDGGPSWENVVSVTAHAGYPAAMFDAHSNTGSIYWHHCIGIAGGGVYDLGGSLLGAAPGFGSGARRNYIRDCTLIRPGTAAQPRNDGGAVEEFLVDGLHIIDGSSAGFSKGASSGSIGKLSIRNLTGNLTDKEQAALNIASGDITEWMFEGIHLTGGQLLNMANSLTNIPTELKIDGFTVRGQSATESDTDVVGVDTGTGSPVVRLQLHNGLIKDMYYAITPRSDLDVLELINVEFDRNFQDILMDAVAVDYIKAFGCTFRRARHLATQGPFVAINGATVATLHIDNFEMDSQPIFIGAGASLTYLILGAGKTHTSFADFVADGSTDEVEILSGSLEDPRILRSNGSPEGVLTANVGAMYLRKDAANAVYFKESGTGNTGWKTTLSGSVAWNPPSLNTATQQTTTVTVTGAALGDHVESVSFSLDLQGTTLNGYVSAADTVTVVHRNDTGGTIDLANGTLRVRVKEA